MCIRDRDYYEYADIAGVDKWHQFTQITLPLLMPSFTVNLTLNITGGLKVFDIIYVLTNGGPGFDTQVISTYTYRSFGIGLLGESCASSVILCVIVMVLTFIFNRYPGSYTHLKHTNRRVVNSEKMY